jgi:hypothetical protein
MKLRHAAALALVVVCACSKNTDTASESWFLMVPPASGTDSFDTSAPLSKWRVSGNFASVAECTSSQADDIKAYEDNTVQVATNVAEFNVKVYRAGRCVASDDPGLKDK